jgi:hypothetical protein
MLGLIILFNVVCGTLGSLGLYGEGWKIAAVTFSSIFMAGLVVVSVITVARAYNSIFSAPLAYNTLLVPVPRWKIILSRIITIVLFDLVSYVIGIAGIVWQSLILTGHGLQRGALNEAGLWLMLGMAAYLLLLSVIFYVSAVHSALSCKRLGKVLAFFASWGSLYLLTFLSAVLIPFTGFERYGVLFSISLNVGWNTPTMVYTGLIVFVSAFLFAVTSSLAERRINI